MLAPAFPIGSDKRKPSADVMPHEQVDPAVPGGRRRRPAEPFPTLPPHHRVPESDAADAAMAVRRVRRAVTP